MRTLLEARNKAGLSLRAVAARVGVSQTTVMRWEERRDFPASLVPSYAKALGITQDELLSMVADQADPMREAA